MPSGRWISKLEATAPATEAARHVLSERLAGVREAVAEVLRRDGTDPEAVHQLRVATRRATAGVACFDACLHPRNARRLSDRLKRLRRAAGRVRDRDVFLAELDRQREQSPSSTWPGLDVLFGDVIAGHSDDQRQLRRACKKEAKLLPRGVRKIVVAGSELSGCAVSAGVMGQSRLRNLAGEFLTRLRSPLARAEDYHALRLALKPLRYAVEIFAGCFDAVLCENVYGTLETLQELLGTIQDRQMAGQRIRELQSRLAALKPPDWKRYELPLQSLVDDLEHTVAALCRDVQEWRAAEADALELHLGHVLSGRPL